jgi:hypothetical protein
MSNKRKPAGIWGRKTPQFYEDLRQQPVVVHTVTGKSFSGTLIGVDVYDIIVRQASGLEILFSKGSIVFVHAKS